MKVENKGLQVSSEMKELFEVESKLMLEFTADYLKRPLTKQETLKVTKGITKGVIGKYSLFFGNKQIGIITHSISTQNPKSLIINIDKI